MSQDETAVNDTVAADTTNTDSAPVENESTVTADNALDDDAFDDIDAEVAKEQETESESDDSDDEEEQSTETEESKITEETKPDNQPKDGDKPLTTKSENRFQKLANENRELKEQLQRLNTQESQVATEQQLLNEVNPETGEYYTPQEAERIARAQALEQSQQTLAQERFNLQVQQNQEAIRSEVSEVLSLPIFSPGNNEFNPQIASQYEDLLSENTIYQYQDGNQYTAKQLMQAGVNLETQAVLVGSNISPIKLAKLIADSSQANAAQYQAQAQRSTEKMLANADVTGGSSSTKTKDDASDFDEGWDQ